MFESLEDHFRSFQIIFLRIYDAWEARIVKIQNLEKNYPKINAKMIPKWFQNDSKMIPENPRESQRIPENPRESQRILENSGESQFH